MLIINRVHYLSYLSINELYRAEAVQLLLPHLPIVIDTMSQ